MFRPGKNQSLFLPLIWQPITMAEVTAHGLGRIPETNPQIVSTRTFIMILESIGTPALEVRFVCRSCAKNTLNSEPMLPSRRRAEQRSLNDVELFLPLQNAWLGMPAIMSPFGTSNTDATKPGKTFFIFYRQGGDLE
jgi:hypothetical protein